MALADDLRGAAVNHAVIAITQGLAGTGGIDPEQLAGVAVAVAAPLLVNAERVAQALAVCEPGDPAQLLLLLWTRSGRDEARGGLIIAYLQVDDYLADVLDGEVVLVDNVGGHRLAGINLATVILDAFRAPAVVERSATRRTAGYARYSPRSALRRWHRTRPATCGSPWPTAHSSGPTSST